MSSQPVFVRTTKLSTNRIRRVFSTNRCTERDSRKDEAVVFIFIFATAGLLIYAAIRPWAEKWFEVSARRHSYTSETIAD